ncbi:hypothetical protein ACFE04_004162 [Oxalis oulophora]
MWSCAHVRRRNINVDSDKIVYLLCKDSCQTLYLSYGKFTWIALDASLGCASHGVGVSDSDDDCRPSRPNSSSSITSSSDWKECDDDDDNGGGISPSRLQRTSARITTNLSISSPTYTGTHPSGTEADDDAEIFTARRRTAAAFEITAQNELVRPLTRLGGGSVGAEWTVVWWFDGAYKEGDEGVKIGDEGLVEDTSDCTLYLENSSSKRVNG